VGTQKHILVVDDEDSVRLTVSVILQKAGYKVFEAKNGPSAFLIAKTHHIKKDPIDLLVTDIMMPKMSGIELKVKLEKASIAIPTLALTASEDQKALMELIRHGFVGCLSKPVAADELKQKVAYLFENLTQAKKKILVIDDEPEIGRNLKTFLEMEDFEVDTAPSGEVGLQKFRAHPFDIVIVDIFMPKKDGLETIDELRRINLASHFIIITGGSSTPLHSFHSDNMLNCKILLKPIDFDFLLETIQEVFAST